MSVSKMGKGAFLLALAASFSLSACSKTESAKAAPDDNSPIELTLFSADPNAAWNNMDDDVGKLLREKTGVTLKPEFAVGGPEQKINLIVASGKYPDIISPKGTTGALIESGALLDLSDLIDKYAPNMKKMLGDQISRLRYSADDRSIYFVPALETIGNVTFEATGCFNLQLALLEEQQYPKIETLADYEKAIATYIAKHPTIDGKPTIGLSLLADDWRILISVTNPAGKTTGAPDDGEYYIDPTTYDAKLHYKRPEEREYFRWLNHMNAIGLLDNESFVQKYDQYKSKIASGRVVALIDESWSFNDALNSLKAEGKPERCYGRFPVVLKQGYKTHDFQATGFNGGWGLAITKSCQNPVRVIKFLDYLASDEGQVLCNWGIEGKHYTYVNGVRTFLPQYDEMRKNDPTRFTRETGIGNYNISLRYGNGVKDPSGNYYTTGSPEQIIATRTAYEQKVLDGYHIKFWKDLYPQPEEFPVKPWGAAWNIPIPQSSPLTLFWQKSQDIIRKRIPEAILVKPDQFDAVYSKMLEELEKNANATANEAEYSKLVKARIALWSGK